MPPRRCQGDGYIRRLLVVGATAVIRRARQDNPSKSWAARLLERKPARLVSVALANKTARIETGTEGKWMLQISVSADGASRTANYEASYTREGRLVSKQHVSVALDD